MWRQARLQLMALRGSLQQEVAEGIESRSHSATAALALPALGQLLACGGAFAQVRMHLGFQGFKAPLRRLLRMQPKQMCHALAFWHEGPTCTGLLTFSCVAAQMVEQLEADGG